MNGKKIKEDREMYVVKSNDLIRARYNLTTQQQKIILFAVSKIKAHDKPGQWYEVSIEELCNACGVKMDDTGYYYKSIKDDLKQLTDRLWVQLPNKSEVTVAWISDAEIIPLSGKVHIKFHEKIEPYLFYLINEGNYTQYKLNSVLIFHNKYAIRLFEILKSYTTRDDIEAGREKEQDFTLDELRNLLGVEGYKRWAEFERNVLKRAIEEINKYSDVFRITYDTYKKGKSVYKINFIINYPTGIEAYKSHEEVRKRMSMQRKQIKRTVYKPRSLNEITESISKNKESINRHIEYMKEIIKQYENVDNEEAQEAIREARTFIEIFGQNGPLSLEPDAEVPEIRPDQIEFIKKIAQRDHLDGSAPAGTLPDHPDGTQNAGEGIRPDQTPTGTH